MIKVVVTGATGFIGKYLCLELLNKGITVYGIGRNEAILNELEENKRFKGIRLDFNSYNKMTDIIKDRGFDCFFHLANYGVNGPDKENYNIQLKNTIIACQMVDAAYTLGCKRYVFAGSVDEFETGNSPDAVFKEPTHSQIYGVAKYSAEQIGKTLAKKHNIEYVSVLLALTYGEGNNTNILPNVIIKKSMSHQKIDLIEGNNTFDMIYITDAIEGIVTVAEKGKSMESYYVGHQQLRTFKEIVEEINQILGNNCILDFGKYKDHGVGIDYSSIDRSKLFRDTGYICQAELKESILDTYAWIKENVYVKK